MAAGFVKHVQLPILDQNEPIRRVSLPYENRALFCGKVDVRLPGKG